MNTKLKFVRFFALLLAALLPFLSLAGILILTPDPYAETFLGELNAKVERLEAPAGTGRIILVGGSSVAFGINSGLLSEYTGREVINFGLYADLGTKLMLDLSRKKVGAGDLVILAPETDAQTLSLFFKSESAWQALGADIRMLKDVASDNYSDLAGGLVGYAAKRLSYALKKEILSPEGIYRRDSFNEYGDIAKPRPYNVMTLGYDPNQPIMLNESILNEKFIAYLNQYIADIEENGAKAVFAFCPMNASAISADSDPVSFYRLLSERLACPVIGNPEDSILDEGYFYDTNFHLNDAGVQVHTAHLIDAIYRFEGNLTYLSLDLPAPTGKAPDDIDPELLKESEWAKYFVYEPFAKGLRIVGVTEEAKALDALEIPSAHDGKPVYILGANALSGCVKLNTLTIREPLSLIEDGALSGCSALESLYMRRSDASTLEVGSGLFDGSNKNATIVLFDSEAYSSFIVGYWWGVYSANMMLAKE